MSWGGFGSGPRGFFLRRRNVGRHAFDLRCKSAVKTGRLSKVKRRTFMPEYRCPAASLDGPCGPVHFEGSPFSLPGDGAFLDLRKNQVGALLHRVATVSNETACSRNDICRT